jgi:molybdopterin synthase catalytic subunit
VEDEMSVPLSRIVVRVSHEKIESPRKDHFQPSDHHGGMNIFLGRVRNVNRGKKVLRMEYDCFIPLCEKTLFDIGQEACEKWAQDAQILIVHRTGKVELGETSVGIWVSTGHRDEAYRVSRYIIEEIKERAPVWKKEFYENGETDWVRGHALCQHRKVNHHDARDGDSTGGREIHPHEAR